MDQFVSPSAFDNAVSEPASSRYQGQAHQGRLSNLPRDATGDGHEECGPGRLDEANVGSVPWIGLANKIDGDSPFTYITYTILCVYVYIYKQYIIYIYNIR